MFTSTRARIHCIAVTRFVCLTGATLLCFSYATGCVKVEDPSARKKITVQDSTTQTPDGKPTPELVLPPSATLSGKPFWAIDDPCAAELDLINDRLVNYYASKKRLPESLEELMTPAEREKQQTLNCPLCNKPYIFVPQPMIPTSGARLICYAPVPDPKDGKTRAIILRPVVGSQMSSAPDVIQLTPDQLKTYLKTAPTAQR